MAGESSRRFVWGLEGPGLTAAERLLFSKNPPCGFLLFSKNLESPAQAAALVEELRSLSRPRPLVFVDQEGGTVDRLGPLLGIGFPAAATLAGKGADRIHQSAFLMGRAARLLGFDVDFAPVVDLGQPGTGAVVLAGRTFGFHTEDVVAAAMVFLHGLARAAVASCLKHFPGLGRSAVDSHHFLPVVADDEVDLMVTDVAAFKRLARLADGVMVGHAAYPGFTRDREPASLSPAIYRMLRGPVGFGGIAYSDDLTMGALSGSIPERAARAAAAGCDVLVVSKGFEACEEAIARVAAADDADAGRAGRLDALRRRCEDAPRPTFTQAAWEELRREVERFIQLLERPGPRDQDE